MKLSRTNNTVTTSCTTSFWGCLSIARTRPISLSDKLFLSKVVREMVVDTGIFQQCNRFGDLFRINEGSAHRRIFRKRRFNIHRDIIDKFARDQTLNDKKAVLLDPALSNTPSL